MGGVKTSWLIKTISFFLYNYDYLIFSSSIFIMFLCTISPLNSDLKKVFSVKWNICDLISNHKQHREIKPLFLYAFFLFLLFSFVVLSRIAFLYLSLSLRFLPICLFFALNSICINYQHYIQTHMHTEILLMVLVSK